MNGSYATRRITVKIPFHSQSNEEIIVDACLSWNVEQLKSHLQNVLPEKPTAENQKLIYSGRILPNNTLLRECFQKVAPECQPVLHMVYRNVKVEETETGIRHRHTEPNNPTMNPSMPSNWNNVPSPLYVPWTNSQNPQYMARLYQTYMQQYAASYGGMAAPTIQPMIPPYLNQNGLSPIIQNVPQPAGNEGQVPAFQPEAQPAGGLVMNAQGGGGMVEDFDDQRDVLDWAFSTFRLVLLLSLIYVSSSTTRFLSVFTLIAFFVAFHTYRNIQRWRQRLQQQNAANNEQPEQPVVRNNPPTENNQPSAAVNPPPETAEQQTSVLSTIMNLLIGFVTSLVPENIAHVVAN